MTQNWTSNVESHWIFSKFYIYIYIYIYKSHMTHYKHYLSKTIGPFVLNLLLLKLKTENTVAK